MKVRLLHLNALDFWTMLANRVGRLWFPDIDFRSWKNNRLIKKLINRLIEELLN